MIERIDKSVEEVAAVEVELMPSELGAPTKYTPITVGKLVAAFNNAYNITEACQYAGIHRDTYYDWLTTQSGFSDKMAEAQSAINRKAKEVVVKAINEGDANMAMKYLEKRDPEFKSKADVDVNLGIRQTREKIKEFLNDGSDDLNARSDDERTESVDAIERPATD